MTGRLRDSPFALTVRDAPTLDQTRQVTVAPESIVVISGKLRFDDFIDDWRLNAKEVHDIDRVIEAKECAP